jgi:hypothetical protein
MTIFIQRFPDWVNTGAYDHTESHLTWLNANIGSLLRSESGSYDDDMVDRYPDGIDYAAKWRQMVDNFHCIKCEPESSYYQIHRLRMYYGDGWQVMQMRGRTDDFVYGEEIVIAIYDELLAMQFKLACM